MIPIKDVGKIASKEKSMTRDLHKWWARRPRSASRVMLYSYQATEKDPNFIIELAKLESNDVIHKARENLLKANNGQPLKMLDPFAGGGNIPSEAYRLGFETHAIDYNPVAVVILKATLEYPAKYPNIYKDVEKWFSWLYEETKKELERFYKGKYYQWVRTAKCPGCQTSLLLFYHLWLSKRHNLTIYPYIEGKEMKVKIIDKPEPKEGVIKKGIINCISCGHVFSAKGIGKPGEKLVIACDDKNDFRLVSEKDTKLYEEAERYFNIKREKVKKELGYDPIPDEELDTDAKEHKEVMGYGFKSFRELFNARQKLLLITLIEKIRLAYKQMLNEGYDKEYAKAVVTYLSFVLGKTVDHNTSLSPWTTDGRPRHLFMMHAIPMTWQYAERNPFPWLLGMIRDINQALFNLCHIPPTGKVPTVQHGTATNLPYNDDYFDMIFTDPPYYDYIRYADLSDFFYVWVKRVIGDLYDNLFKETLTDKTGEIIERGDKEYYKESLTQALKEMFRVLKPNGTAMIMYAYKHYKGWLPLFVAVMKSGLRVIDVVIIETENKERYISRQSPAVISTSIYIICKKMAREKVGLFKDVFEEYKNYLPKKLSKLVDEGINEIDLRMASVSTACEVFGKYENIIDDFGYEMSWEEIFKRVINYLEGKSEA